MSKKDAALKIAIEALEKSQNYIKEETIESIYVRQAIGYATKSCKEAIESQSQPLSNEEIKKLWEKSYVNGCLEFERITFFARAIEQKLKEKNHGTT